MPATKYPRHKIADFASQYLHDDYLLEFAMLTRLLHDLYLFQVSNFLRR